LRRIDPLHEEALIVRLMDEWRQVCYTFFNGCEFLF
jgi:hypothetical protein